MSQQELAGTGGEVPAPPKQDEPVEIHPVRFFENGGDPFALDADMKPIVEKVKPLGGMVNPDGSAAGPVSAPPSDQPVQPTPAVPDQEPTPSAETTAALAGPAKD